MFKQIEDDEALIVERGVFKTAEVYEGPNGGLFVKAKGGFVRVRSNGSTSHPTVRLESLHRDGSLYQDDFGRLCVDAAPGRKAVLLAEPGSNTLALPAPEAEG